MAKRKLKMTEQETIKKLEEINKKVEERENGYDKEDAHLDADKALCDFLEELGYRTVVECFLEVPKWYKGTK
jgi:hypothetical protein